jgi:hypothetical protein
MSGSSEARSATPPLRRPAAETTAAAAAALDEAVPVGGVKYTAAALPTRVGCWSAADVAGWMGGQDVHATGEWGIYSLRDAATAQMLAAEEVCG